MTPLELRRGEVEQSRVTAVATLSEANDRLQLNLTRRAETEAGLAEAREALRLASLSAGGDSDQRFRSAADEVGSLESRLHALDSIALPASREALQAAQARLAGCDSEFAELALRARIVAEMGPADEEVSRLFHDLSAAIGRSNEVRKRLRSEFSEPWQSLFRPGLGIGFAPEWFGVAASITPDVREFVKPLFESPYYPRPWEDPRLPYDPEALGRLLAELEAPAARTDTPASGAVPEPALEPERPPWKRDRRFNSYHGSWHPGGR